MSSDLSPDPIAVVYRQVFGRAVAAVARSIGDLGLAEEAVQEAFSDAVRTWPERGRPDNPVAWITTAARHRALDVLRREALRGDKEAEATRLAALRWEPPVMTTIPDDRLRTIFTCCHPALSVPSQVALTLRLVCGLTTAEIARAFLQPEATVAQRISRAKGKIRRARIPLTLPADPLLAERVPVVLACVHLVFTEGYFATSGDRAIRDPLCDEAIRLGRLLVAHRPDDGEGWALLALMLLHDSRREQRRTADGGLVPLEEQDRSEWNRSRIDEGLQCLATAVRCGPGGAYRDQARIAAAHATATSWSDTDWARIVRAYDDLATRSASPAVLVNRAVAVAFRDGFAAGLAALDAVDPAAVPSAFHATRADLLRRAGRTAEAWAEYALALPLAPTEPVRAHLLRRIAELGGGIR